MAGKQVCQLHSRGVRTALVGLLLLSAISVAVASGRKPESENAAVSIRMLTDAEAAQVRQRLLSLQPQSQVVGQLESELLERLFPSVSFYKALRSDVLPPLPYLIAASGDKLLGMPYGFNRLLAENNMRTSSENVIVLGKAFVVLAVGNEPIKNRGGTWVRTARLDTFPPVVFLEATTSKPVINGDYYDARLTVRIGEQTEEWYFRVWQNQFSFVLRRSAEGPVKEYLPATVESLPHRGQLELTPDMIIEASRKGDTQVERDSLRTELASGSEPEEGHEVTVSMRRLSTSEVVSILDKFPEMMPSYIDSRKYSVDILAQLFPLCEVTAAPLKRAFPAARFYKGLKLSLPPVPYLMAVFGDKRYPMYGSFNMLLVDNGLKVTDESILALAEAFVILVLGGETVYGNPELGGPEGDELLAFKQASFLDAETIAEVRGGISYDARLKVKIGDGVEEWYFDSYFSEFRVVSRGSERGLIKQYDPVFAEPPSGRGRSEPRPGASEQEK